MAPPSLRPAALIAVLLLACAAQARGWATEVADDMVPAETNVMVAMPGGGVGTTLSAPLCLQCRCCSKSNPAQCAMVSCCSTFNCDPAGKCNLVQQKCGCQGCGGAN